jgi:hypothetical protein
VQSDKKSGRVALNGPHGEQVYVWPVFMPADARRKAALAPEFGFAAVRKLAAAVLPDIAWSKPETVEATTVCMHGQAGQSRAVAMFTWVGSPKGNAGYFFATAAAADRYRQMEADFARMLQSVRIAGTRAAETAPRPKFASWRDPRENAFSLNVPDQWRVNGGMFRYAAVDTRATVEAVSPDGRTRITSGDAEIPTFAIPNPMLTYAGFSEGSWYSPGYGVNMMVRQVVPPAAFARGYAGRTAAARDCGEFNVVDERERPDAAQALNAVYAQYGLPVTIHAGEVAFTCRMNGRAMQGYYFTAIQVVQQMGNGMWNVEKLFGYLTPAGKSGWTQDIMNTMLKSFAINPQWASMQQHLTGNVSGIVSRTQEVIAGMTNDAYWSRQASLDELDRRRENAIFGTVDVVDPATGREMKIEDSADYVWIDPRGNIVGTQTDALPDLDFRQLTRLP